MMVNVEGRPLALLVAYRFGERMAEEIGPDDLTEAVRRNRAETVEGVCHTHDFCDANMVMFAALGDFGLADDFDPADEAQARLWNDAWALAVRCGFFVEATER